MKKISKKQTGGEKSPAEIKEARRDSLYKASKAKSDSTLKAMMADVKKVNAPRGKDTTRVGSIRITTMANKKKGGQTKSKKK